MTVIEPAEFNEKFTIYLNAEGHPVERTLREMTGGEVVLAIEWQDRNVARLQVESALFTAKGELPTKGEPPTDAMLPMTHDFANSVALLREAGQAMDKMARLLSLVEASIPPRYRKLELGVALARGWPGGRAA